MLSIIIPIYNEKVHLERVLSSALEISNDVCVVDSFSTDGSVEICKLFNVRYFSGHFSNFAEKMNFALTEIDFQNEWILRLDADEYLTREFIFEINTFLQDISDDVCGVDVRRRIYFLGRWLKHGDMYTSSHTRITRTNNAKYEQRNLDEHVIINGKKKLFKFDIVEEPLRPLSFWLSKHIGYATVQARMELTPRARGSWKNLSGKPRVYRFLKECVYEKLPLFIRPTLYFFYRYILRLGFLDGVQGFLYAVLHAYCYRLFVDALMYEENQRK